ncbi:GNAT family N-acetyltransferase (plasmid) [Bacillus toyonensis]|uniref:GNAT family N-acetyltransferase n=1 Tax=Bacillus cereus group TaxID=86661 RepID=UPI000BEB8FDF|nr:MULTISPECIES: GNAT family protein [Bacillus cereus group]MBJ7933144.1 GNAT family N-acetyltransferase [Bacillus cereus group sp. N31]PDY86405.1 GNAT family N-acetyltransferase [Bacillus toyonensis]PEG13085.1 GNAT family N-acetyltransferase [Bacillus toyonensis]PGE70036.1 GNAT family N-acetyltransferase [Bacillus toyonensis]PHB51672.1 GNAT family N-acetyltransferase [Bacillus toyonensis]
MEITTERLIIRPFKGTDLQDVFAIYNNDDTCKYLLHNKWTHEDMQKRFDQKLANNVLTTESILSLAVIYRTKVVGDLSVWYTDMKDTVEIGYSFSNEVAGRGLATEAVSSLVFKLFDEFNVHRIQANLDARNTASQKLCERIGMRQEAHFIQDFWSKNEWTDSLVYGMLSSDLK